MATVFIADSPGLIFAYFLHICPLSPQGFYRSEHFYTSLGYIFICRFSTAIDTPC